MTLKSLREKRSLTRKELSAQSGVNLRTLQDYEQGHKSLASAKGETVYRLAMALGCTADTLLDMQMLPAYTPGEEDLCSVEPLLTYKIIEEQTIWCENFKCFGRWKFDGDHCSLLFLYRGEIVRLPFRAAFTEKTLPWLVETAVMEMELYIECAEFDRNFQGIGGEPWGE